MTAGAPRLARRLGFLDAYAIGLGSMIGAGVFVVFAPAARAAGSALLVGLAIAAFVAYCNATASAQLAAQYPSSGGSYVYGRERLGAWWGFAAGWSFVIGKTASCAAMALTFAAYAVPEPWQRPLAIAAVLALAAVNSRGVTRTAGLTRVLVVCVLVVLALVVAALVIARPGGTAFTWTTGSGWYGILQAAGLLFFAFAGYARIATMGEEVKDPERTIPRAIAFALATTVVIYAVIAVVLLGVLGPDALAGSSAPLADAARTAALPWLVPAVQLGATLASLGALLALIAGVGRTALAMARNGDLPRALSGVHPRFQVPHRAEFALAAVVSCVILIGDVRLIVGFSSFGVLLYYFVANLAAFTQPTDHRRFPRWLQAVGALGCLTLVATLPLSSVLVGLCVLILGFAVRAIAISYSRRHRPSP